MGLDQRTFPSRQAPWPARLTLLVCFRPSVQVLYLRTEARVRWDLLVCRERKGARCAPRVSPKTPNIRAQAANAGPNGSAHLRRLERDSCYSAVVKQCGDTCYSCLARCIHSLLSHGGTWCFGGNGYPDVESATSPPLKQCSH